MDDGENGPSIDTARSLALQLVQYEPPQRRPLTRIYRDKLACPLSVGLEGLLLQLEDDKVELPAEAARRHENAAAQTSSNL
jgi:hypothetical protein